MHGAIVRLICVVIVVVVEYIRNYEKVFSNIVLRDRISDSYAGVIVPKNEKISTKYEPIVKYGICKVFYLEHKKYSPRTETLWWRQVA